MNYPVPDFGKDEDVLQTQKNIRRAEKSLKTTMNANFG